MIFDLLYQFLKPKPIILNEEDLFPEYRAKDLIRMRAEGYFDTIIDSVKN
ncbi:MAG: hypothetical protein ABFD50_08295 [Smithella sp.]